MLVMNEMGEFVDTFDPNPDEMRMKAYASLRRLSPKDMVPRNDMSTIESNRREFYRTRKGM